MQSSPSSGKLLLHDADLFKSEIVDHILEEERIAMKRMQEQEEEQDDYNILKLSSSGDHSYAGNPYYNHHNNNLDHSGKMSSRRTREDIVKNLQQKVKEQNKFRRKLYLMNNSKNTAAASSSSSSLPPTSSSSSSPLASPSTSNNVLPPVDLTPEERKKFEQVQRKKEQRRKEYEEEKEKFKREMERQKIIKQKLQDEKFVVQYNELLKERNEFLTQVKQELIHQDFSKQLKKEELFEKWNKLVFEPIQDSILRQLNRMSSAEIEQRRLDLFEKFLKESNSKVGIFRDIIIETDYDPMEANQYTIKYQYSDVKNPTKQFLSNYAKEKNFLSDKAADVKSKSKEVLDITLWDKLDATPHGHYSKMFKSASEPSNHHLKLAGVEKEMAFKSNIKFDHYNIDTGKEAVLKEVPKGKRVKGFMY